MDVEGRILGAGGNWIKVAGITRARAKNLDDWRQKKQRIRAPNPPANLPYTLEYAIKQPFVRRYKELDEEEKQIRLQILREKSSIPNRLSPYLAEAKKTEQALVSEAPAKKNAVALKFKMETDGIRKRIAETEASFSKEKINRIRHFEQSSAHLKEKMSRNDEEKIDRDRNIKTEFDRLQQSFIDELKRLDVSFCDDIAGVHLETDRELKTIAGNYEPVFAECRMRICRDIEAFNRMKHSLVELQDEYER